MDRVNLLENVIVTPLRVIDSDLGKVLKGGELGADGILSIKEVYFSTVYPGKVKGWKAHQKMTINLVVVHGQVKFVIFDKEKKLYMEKIMSPTEGNHFRLTVPPGLWVSFGAASEVESIVCNMPDHVHDPNEADAIDLHHESMPDCW